MQSAALKLKSRFLSSGSRCSLPPPTHLFVVIFLPLMILVEVDTERKFPMPPPPPPPKDVELKEVKPPPPPRLPMVVMWPRVFMGPKEPNPEMNSLDTVSGCTTEPVFNGGLYSHATLTWVKRRKASTKRRKTNKAPVKWAACSIATWPALGSPSSPKKWVIAKWIWTWHDRRKKMLLGTSWSKRLEKCFRLRLVFFKNLYFSKTKKEVTCWH